MKIVICDDEINDRSVIESHIKSHNLEHHITQFESAIPFIEQVSKGVHYDVLFLDVQMPDSDGWEVAQQLKLSKTQIYVAMITVMSDYVFHCFDRVDWFAPKPVSKERIHQILENAQEKLFPKIIKFKSNKISFELTAPEILYIEVQLNNAYVHTFDREYKARIPLKEIKEMLSGFPCFVQTHHSYIINLDHYVNLVKNDIVLKTGIRVPISRNWRENFFKSINEFIKRR